MDYWAVKHNWGVRRRAELAAFLQPYAVIDSDRDLCRRWAEIRANVHRNGGHIDTADAWTAAIALLHGIPQITHNRNHFVHIAGLKVISEASS